MGMLVDNAIVVTDNAQIAIARGIDRRKALIDGATGPNGDYWEQRSLPSVRSCHCIWLPLL